MFGHTVTSLLLAALLILQSSVPCCAISQLLKCGGSSEDVNTQQAPHCSCCPHSLPQPDQIPSDDGHFPDGKCPFCSGRMLDFAADNVRGAVARGHLVYAPLDDALGYRADQTPALHSFLQRQFLGQPFLNASMCLLI